MTHHFLLHLSNRACLSYIQHLAYLGSDLVAALSGLQMNNFPHGAAGSLDNVLVET
jgi:hypothetical protein